MSSYYANLAQTRATMASDSSLDSSLILRLIRTASQRIDNTMSGARNRPYFEPYNEERQYVVSSRHINSALNTFWFQDPLLSFSAVTAAGSAVTSSAVQYPPLVTPFNQLRITNRSTSWYGCGSGYPPYFISITGVWGYHGNYANAWLETGTLSANIDASVTDVAVQTGEGALFSPGMLLRVGTEYMRVISITDNTLTVQRGVNGSTAATHTDNDAVEVWQVTDDIVNVTARQAGAMYARRGKYDNADVGGVGILQYPPDLLTELLQVLTEYQYK